MLANIRRTYAMYIVVGAAAIPAGILYALLAVNRWERWWADLAILACGLLTGHFTWRSIERRANRVENPSSSAARPLPHFPGLK